MGAVRMLARTELRGRRRRVLLLTLLVGLVGAVTLASIAGARRTGSALERFRSASRSADLELFVGDATRAQLDSFEHLPRVAAFAELRGLATSFPRAPQLQAVAGELDDHLGRVVDRARIVEGRWANPRAVDEVTIGEALASQLHLHAGDHLDGGGFSPARVQMFLCACGFPAGPVETGPPVPDGPHFSLRIVGVVRRPLDLGDRGAAGGVLITTQAFAQRYRATIGSFNGTILRVRTRRGAADVQGVVAAAQRIFGRSPEFQTQDLAIDTQGAQNAIDVLTVALWVLAVVTALAGVVAIAIILGREISSTAGDGSTYRALGVTGAQRVAVDGAQAVPVALGGAALAVIGAVAASPLFPIGVARRAEPSPGVDVDPVVLALGAVAVGCVTLALALVSSVRKSRASSRVEDPGRSRTSPAVEATARAGWPPVLTNGVRMALERGRGRGAVPVRSAVCGAVFGLLGIVAVSTFASSADRLVASPARYGWTWDFAAVVDDPGVFGAMSPVRHEPGLAAVAELATDNIQVDGHPVNAWAYTPMRGTIRPAVVAGRAPRGAGEIALGTATLDEIGKSVGDTVQAHGPAGTVRYHVVGSVAFPKLDVPQPVANGAALTGGGLDRIVNESDTNTASHYLLARVTRRSALASTERRVAGAQQFGIERPFGASVPLEVSRLHQVGWLPATLAALLALLATAAVAHALVTSVRRRRRELAVLRTLGFSRRQVRATVAWQATTIATLGVVAGVPLGLLVGALAWQRVAESVGVPAPTAFPTAAVLLTAAGALAVANVVAYLPARATASVRPAAALRTE